MVCVKFSAEKFKITVIGFPPHLLNRMHKDIQSDVISLLRPETSWVYNKSGQCPAMIYTFEWEGCTFELRAVWTDLAQDYVVDRVELKEWCA